MKFAVLPCLAISFASSQISSFGNKQSAYGIYILVDQYLSYAYILHIHMVI